MTVSGFRLLFSSLESKKVSILTKCTACPLQLFTKLQFSVLALSCMVCTGKRMKCWVMSARTGRKVSDHISSKDSDPHLQGYFGQDILSP